MTPARRINYGSEEGPSPVNGDGSVELMVKPWEIVTLKAAL
jgi:hypothetical protein